MAPPEESPKRDSRLAAFGAPLILVIVALAQITTAKISDLSPWKGGGFGMFSTIESPASRVVKARLNTRMDTIRVPVPSKFAKAERRIRTRPTRDAVYRLAQNLASTTWVPYTMEPVETKYRGLGGESDGVAPPDSIVAELNRAFARMRAVRPLPAGERTDAPIEVSSVEVASYQIRFDAGQAKLTLRPIVSATYDLD